jgi:methanogenic corrinoid protein MtbC1
VEREAAARVKAGEGRRGVRTHTGDARHLAARIAVVEVRDVRILAVFRLFLSHALTLRHHPADRYEPYVQAPTWHPDGLVSVREHREAFLAALLARDSARARDTVEAALEDGLPIPDAYLELLVPALREVGHRWAMGTLNVAEEHYATAVAESILDGLSRRFKRAPKDGRLAVVSGTPEELHALGARMVADFLESDGWEVLQLGPGPPTEDLAELVASEQPDVVALSTATAGALDRVAEVIHELSALYPRPLIVVGGQLWTARTSATALDFGADLVLQDLRELVAVLHERVPPLDLVEE